MSELGIYDTGERAKALAFKLYTKDLQRLHNLKALLRDYYIDDLDIKEVDLDTWAEMKLIDKNSDKLVEIKQEEIETLKREISTLRHERYKAREENKELRMVVDEKDKIINSLNNGKNLRTLREQSKLLREHKIKQKTIAEKAGCTQSHVSNYLNGKIQSSSFKEKIQNSIDKLLEEHKGS